jgi:hypothetical protein
LAVLHPFYSGLYRRNYFINHKKWFMLRYEKSIGLRRPERAI